MNGSDVVYLHPGEIFFGREQVLVSTVLGSCLAITMFCETNRFSGISHCIMPKCTQGNSLCSQCAEPYKYVDCTIIKMLEIFNSKNIKNEDIEIKMFGGADVLKPINKLKNISSVGDQNIKSALNMLDKLKLKLVSKDVGGKLGRKIIYRVNTGEVYLKRLIDNAKN